MLRSRARSRAERQEGTLRLDCDKSPQNPGDKAKHGDVAPRVLMRKPRLDGWTIRRLFDLIGHRAIPGGLLVALLERPHVENPGSCHLPNDAVPKRNPVNQCRKHHGNGDRIPGEG